MFLIVPPLVFVLLHEMAFKYWYLLSRNQTEKESVARRRYARSQQIEDKQEKLTYIQCIKNVWGNIMRKNPESVLTIARKMKNAPIVEHEPTDDTIAGMQNDSFDSSSSSDEIPEFLRPKPLNIQYAKQPNVLIVGGDGKILGSVPPEELKDPDFMKRFNELKAIHGNEETKEEVDMNESNNQILTTNSLNDSDINDESAKLMGPTVTVEDDKNDSYLENSTELSKIDLGKSQDVPTELADSTQDNIESMQIQEKQEVVDDAEDNEQNE